jgi:polysaccharide export outer membrane protein
VTRRRARLAVAAVTLGAIALAPPARAQDTSSATPSIIAPAVPAADYRIGPKDVLSITVFGEPDLTGKSYTVDGDGMFSFPMVGRVKAAGLTVPQLEQELRHKLVPDYFKNPQISINIDQYVSQQIMVSGAVGHPGPQPYTGGLRLLAVLAQAGGTLPSAAGQVLVAQARQIANRPGSASSAPQPAPDDDDSGIDTISVDLIKLQGGDLSLDIPIRDGDTILVPRAEMAYVLGEVKAPGGVPVPQNATLQQIISLAGGLTPEAADGRITIDRDGKVLKDVKMTDAVKAGDTIKVPTRFF